MIDKYSKLLEDFFKFVLVNFGAFVFIVAFIHSLFVLAGVKNSTITFSSNEVSGVLGFALEILFVPIWTLLIGGLIVLTIWVGNKLLQLLNKFM